jgi:predicted nucleic acid-binding protein
MTRHPKSVVVDSGFWYALFEPRDQHHSEAEPKTRYLDEMNVLVPWPSLYETLRTRFAKDTLALLRFEAYLKKPRCELVDDQPYRDLALEQTLRQARIARRPMSLVDVVIRLILDDANVRKDCLLTFNVKDFADVCRRRNIQIL